MSRYRGNHDACPVCGLTYGALRTGLDWREVWQSLWSPDDDPGTWRQKTRATVLGRWHERKRELWRGHLDQCALAAEQRRLRAQRRAARRLAKEELEKLLAKVPF